MTRNRKWMKGISVGSRSILIGAKASQWRSRRQISSYSWKTFLTFSQTQSDFAFLHFLFISFSLQMFAISRETLSSFTWADEETAEFWLKNYYEIRSEASWPTFFSGSRRFLCKDVSNIPADGKSINGREKTRFPNIITGARVLLYSIDWYNNLDREKHRESEDAFKYSRGQKAICVRFYHILLPFLVLPVFAQKSKMQTKERSNGKRTRNSFWRA